MDEAAETHRRLESLGFSPADASVLAAHFLEAERTGRTGHGLRRVEWLEGWKELDRGGLETGELEMGELETAARPLRAISEPGYERWDGNGALGYLVLDQIVEAQLAEPPANARVVVAGRTFPTGMLGHWTRRLAEGGLVAALTATSPRRLGHPAGGPKLTGTNPLSIAIPSSDGRPLVTDVSMGNLTYGDVLAGRATEADLEPFGAPQAHKAFALAAGLQLFVDALTPDDGFGAVLVVARPAADPVPAFRELAAGARLPGDR
ncbi:MAG TPA: Ldh family oxidoreductase [Gaiellaceae bacterium]|nr:Ldh family oxidoreductase [Gaiellaceae bacterium]